jgi:pimeloyl-ACP methyl ester carboxylesterase
MKRKMIIILMVTTVVVLLLTASCRSSLEQKMLFFPTHHAPDGVMEPWSKDGQPLGYARTVPAPKNVWLMLHGNGGEATDRTYALPCFSPGDSVYILEYPGYGNRDGVPSAKSFNQAAEEGYRLLRATYPHLPVCVVGESIGSGPASALAGLEQPPDKIVLVVPFDQLSLVAKDHYAGWVVDLLLSNDWDNRKALANYKGPVDIFGAKDDQIIPVKHAIALAGTVPGAKFILIEGGHNEWSQQPQVKIRNP